MLPAPVIPSGPSRVTSAADRSGPSPGPREAIRSAELPCARAPTLTLRPHWCSPRALPLSRSLLPGPVPGRSPFRHSSNSAQPSPPPAASARTAWDPSDLDSGHPSPGSTTVIPMRHPSQPARRYRRAAIASRSGQHQPKPSGLPSGVSDAVQHGIPGSAQRGIPAGRPVWTAGQHQGVRLSGTARPSRPG